VKIRFIDDGGAAVERDCLAWRDVRDVVLPHLETVDDASLRRAHVCIMEAAFASNGLERMGIGSGVLNPIEEEMRRRGMQADCWSRKQKLRSDLAFVEAQRRDRDTGASPEYLGDLERQERTIREELRLLETQEEAQETPDMP
jgi:hypothetical protein